MINIPTEQQLTLHPPDLSKVQWDKEVWFWAKQFHSNIPVLFSPLITEGAAHRKPDAFFGKSQCSSGGSTDWARGELLGRALPYNRGRLGPQKHPPSPQLVPQLIHSFHLWNADSLGPSRLREGVGTKISWADFTLAAFKYLVILTCSLKNAGTTGHPDTNKNGILPSC